MAAASTTTLIDELAEESHELVRATSMKGLERHLGILKQA